MIIDDRNLVEEIVAANQRIKAVDGGVRETPLDEAPSFSERTGATFLLKGEHLQRTGSFKMRGAMNKVLTLSEEQRAKGITTASTGNHGMATAQAASVGNVEATIYLPNSVSPLKHGNITRMEAKTVLVEGTCVDSERTARAAATKQGITYVSAYADLDVIAGQGTIGLELATQCPDLAAVYICVGGGGLISGVGSYLKSCLPDADIIGCWAENAASMHHCLEKGEIYDAWEADTLADGSAGGVEEGTVTFPICQQVIDRHVLVSEEEIAQAMRDVAANERFIVEGSAGVAVAAALKTGSDYQGKKIAVVICGRNIGYETFCDVLNSVEGEKRNA
ncbi:threonine/serine dehydratase [Kiloniella sp.]|uniref:threonine/serine dehydratase n=1 Tax=Kiloniella sp. TaxID=1938587 RepID=UPI003A927CAC